MPSQLQCLGLKAAGLSLRCKKLPIQVVAPTPYGQQHLVAAPLSFLRGGIASPMVVPHPLYEE